MSNARTMADTWGGPKKSPPCITCGKPADWSVDWIFPQRVPDNRPCCSGKCANSAVARMQDILRLTLEEADRRFQAGTIREVDALRFVEVWNAGPHFCKAEVRDGTIRLELKP